MSNKKKPVLGRNLSSMLSQTSLAKASAQALDTRQARTAEKSLPIENIHPGPYQPRSHFDADRLEELADSIRAQGLIQPIVVRRTGDDYEIIAGERRWRAAQLAGLDQVPVILREADDETVIALALIENIQREDLNPLEEAQALKQLVEEFHLTHQQAAEAVGRSRSSVSNLLRLLDLAEGARALLSKGQLEMGHARALLALPSQRQEMAAREVVARGLTARETEALVKRWLDPSQPVRKTLDPDVQRLQDELSERLCAEVRIQHGRGGKGRLLIKYHSADELEGIIGHLKRSD
jgi:ParB family chromosome partitioning protein